MVDKLNDDDDKAESIASVIEVQKHDSDEQEAYDSGQSSNEKLPSISFSRLGSTRLSQIGDDAASVTSANHSKRTERSTSIASSSKSDSTIRRFDRKGKKAVRTVAADEPITVPSSSPTPPAVAARSSRTRRGRQKQPFVDIPLLPLPLLRSYYHPDRLLPPTLRSRQQLFDSDNIPFPIASSSRSSSIVAIAHPRPKREVTKRPPLWGRTAPLFREGVLQLSEDDEESEQASSAIDEADMEVSDDEEDEERNEDRYGESEDELLLRRPKRRPLRSSHHNYSPKYQRKLRPRLPSTPASTQSSPSSSSSIVFQRQQKRKREKPREDGMRPPPRTGRKKYNEDHDSDFNIDHEGEEEIDDEHELSSDVDDEKKGKAEKEEEDVLTKHRSFCEKCSRGPANVMLERARNQKKKPGRKKRKQDDDEITDEELADQLEGWLECEKCVVSSHWGCLAPNQKSAVLLALRNEEGPPREGQRARRAVGIDETATFVCAKCKASPACFVCHKSQIGKMQDSRKVDTDVESDKVQGDNVAQKSPGVADEDTDVQMAEEETDADHATIMFRCLRCKQGCHYEHLKIPFEADEDHDLADIAEHYQKPWNGRDDWLCHQCREWIWAVDNICAWRPSPPDAMEPKRAEGEKAHYKDDLPREYLVKWVGRGFRHVTWVPHQWLLALSHQRLRNFLEKGPTLDLITDETLAARGDEMDHPTIAMVIEEDEKLRGKGESKRSHGGVKSNWEGHGPPPDTDAEASIPTEWSTVDRVLDVMLRPPKKTQKKSQPPPKRGKRILSASVSASPSPANDVAPDPDVPSRPDGIEPPPEERMEIDEWEKKAGRILTGDDTEEVAEMITWCFVKWDDLQYDQSCWDTPPPVDSPLYPAFKHALRRYLRARQVFIPVLSPAQCEERDDESNILHVPPESQPDCVVGGKLMPFQMEGFQWLLYKHFKRESCILADDMGLGKTIQIASLLGYLGSDALKIYPCLVIVPNSTITNWVREFEKWVPHMRVVPYYGESASRKIISKYELYHKGLQNKTPGLKAHVVLTTYDMITSNNFPVFKGIPRWEVLCVDEGQRLKSDSNLIFNRLKALNSVHRILLTGTPLNNNLRELFNLLHFLDPDTFRNLEDLEARFENLNEGLIQELHVMIKPYILRRIKADVLKLPPKVEIIVPISMSPLQKNLYKGILERNAEVLRAIAEARRKRAKAAGARKPLTIGTNGENGANGANGEAARTEEAGDGNKAEAAQPLLNGSAEQAEEKL